MCKICDNPDHETIDCQFYDELFIYDDEEDEGPS